MPNKRSKEVKRVGLWINVKLLADFKDRCKTDNLTVTEALLQLITHYVNH
jgi:hypothetical protein